ncbi:unnamed protein product, partial [Porites lobata]
KSNSERTKISKSNTRKPIQSYEDASPVSTRDWNRPWNNVLLCWSFSAWYGKVEIIANDQGNRTTPSYVAFTETERLIGDSAKNQATVWYHGPKIGVQSKGALKTFVFYPRENGFMVLKKMKKKQQRLTWDRKSLMHSYCACIFQRLSDTGH